MSASLVGSEMCIRDSTSIGSRCAGDGDAGVPLRTLAVLREALPADGASHVANESVVAMGPVLFVHAVEQGN
eukprot:11751240-Alexandrium_andersonii.AAC.1